MRKILVCPKYLIVSDRIMTANNLTKGSKVLYFPSSDHPNMWSMFSKTRGNFISVAEFSNIPEECHLL